MRRPIGLVLVVIGALLAISGTPAGAPGWIAAAALTVLGVVTFMTGTSHRAAPRPDGQSGAGKAGADSDVTTLLSPTLFVSGSKHSSHSDHHGSPHDGGHGIGDGGGGGASGGGGDGGGSN